jgi:hyperosmotically inducible periplasmic protein
MQSRILAAVTTVALAFSIPVHAEESVGNVVDDSTISATIKASLFDNKNTHATQINIDTYKGIVQLSGFVRTEAEKDAAGKIAKDTSGVKEVHNSLDVHDATSVGTKLDDSILTAEVKAALLDADKVKSGPINVVSEGGIVQLAGFVNSAGMVERAGKIAAGVSGVKQVDNQLLVKPK